MPTKIPKHERFHVRRLPDDWYGVFADLPLSGERKPAPAMIAGFSVKSEAVRYADLLNAAVHSFYNDPITIVVGGK